MHCRVFQIVNNGLRNLINARLQWFKQTTATDNGIESGEFDALLCDLVEHYLQTEIVLIEDRFVGSQLLARMAYGDLGYGFQVAIQTNLCRGRSGIDD